jgi:tetratricopeptide (TPR) repeat protein
VSQPAANQLKLIDAGSAAMRVLLVLVTLAALLVSWQAARWYTGSEIAYVLPQMREGALEAAEAAVQLAPDDPLAHSGLATLEQRSLTPEQLQSAIAEYEKAVSLSPRDFRLWVDLGRSLEQAGDLTRSEKALRRGVELAPWYSWTRWHMGNFLVRRGRYDEAFAELRRVAETDETKRGAVFDLAWYVYGGDIASVRSLLGDSPRVRAELVSYLLGRKRMDDALQLWAGLSSEERKASGDVAKLLFDQLIAAKRFRDALGLSPELSQSPAAAPEVGKISNGGFEKPMAQGGNNFFDWHVPSSAAASVALDPANAREGGLSLRVTFNASGAVDFNITQAVAIEPGANYRLQFYVRTNSLKSGALPVVQVLSPDGKLLAESAPAPGGKSDWQQVSLDFKTLNDVDAITLRITRAQCTAEGGVCPIFGNVWYDDFNLQLLNRDAGARGAGRGN